MATDQFVCLAPITLITPDILLSAYELAKSEMEEDTLSNMPNVFLQGRIQYSALELAEYLFHTMIR